MLVLEQALAPQPTDGRISRVYPSVDPGVHASEVLRDARSLEQPAFVGGGAGLSFHRLDGADDEELREKTLNGCCSKSGSHADDKRSSCMADCSFVFMEVGVLDIGNRLHHFDFLLSSLYSRGSINLFRPPRRHS